jgi:hypothetical protein
MKIFNTLEEYKQVAKTGDIITLEGTGILDGLKATCKNDCFKVYKLQSSSGFVGFKRYNAKNGLTTSTPQKVGLIDKKVYKSLPIY